MKPNFYDIKNNILIERNDVGIEEIIPIYSKFVSQKIIKIKDEKYLYGYFLLIDDYSERIVPNPIGVSYVKKKEMICFDVKILFKNKELIK